jgi:hypothetical protein
MLHEHDGDAAVGRQPAQELRERLESARRGPDSHDPHTLHGRGRLARCDSTGRPRSRSRLCEPFRSRGPSGSANDRTCARLLLRHRSRGAAHRRSTECSYSPRWRTGESRGCSATRSRVPGLSCASADRARGLAAEAILAPPETVLAQLVVERRTMDPQDSGGGALVPLRELERLQNRQPFDFDQ